MSPVASSDRVSRLKLDLLWLEPILLIALHFGWIKPELALPSFIVEHLDSIDHLVAQFLPPTLHIDAPYEDPEEVQGVCDDDNCVEDDIGEADAYQKESQHIAHFSAYIAAKEQQYDAEEVDCHFIDHVLIVDD